MSGVDLLHGLDAVNWSELRHAYGPASDVPAMLRMLRSTDDAELDNSYYALYGTIFHQGSSYDSTAAAVPFLYALLDAKDTPRRESLQRLLLFLAVGNPVYKIPRGIEVEEWRSRVAEILAPGYIEEVARKLNEWIAEAPDEEERQIREEKILFSKNTKPKLQAQVDEFRAYEAVKQGLRSTYRCLEDELPAVRALAAYTLGYFPDEMARGEAALLSLLAREGDDVVRGAAMLALALLHAPSKKDFSGTRAAQRLEEYFTQDGLIDFTRWCSAAALLILRVQKAAYVHEVTRKLTDASYLDEFESTMLTESSLPFKNPSLTALAALVLEDVKASRYPEAARALAGALRKATGLEGPVILTTSLLRVAFDGVRQEELPAFSDLTEVQQDAVRALTAVDQFKWRLFNFTQVLREWGLPSEESSLHSYIGTTKDATDEAT